MRIRVAEIRKAQGITQAALAKRLGISSPYLHQIENGIRNMSNERQKQIGEALGVDPRELIDFSGSQDDISRVLDAYDRASPADRSMILSWAKAILDRPE